MAALLLVLSLTGCSFLDLGDGLKLRDADRTVDVHRAGEIDFLAVDALILSDDGDFAYLGMDGVTCRWSRAAHALDHDEDVDPLGTDVPVDELGGEVVVAGPSGVVLVQAEPPAAPGGEGVVEVEVDSAGGQPPFGPHVSLDVPGATSAGYGDGGLVALVATPTCAVVWSGTSSRVESRVEVDARACLSDADLVVRPDGSVVLAYGEVAIVRPDGATVLGEGVDVAVEPASGTIVATPYDRHALVAWDAHGVEAWQVPTGWSVRDLAPVARQGAVAVLLDADLAWERTVVLVDVDDGRVLARAPLDRDQEVHALAASGDGGLVAAWGYDGARLLRVE